MKSLLKWLLIAVLVVVFVPLLIGLVVATVIDPNDFKPQIIEVVEKNTRGSLTIDGELSWSFFPSIGVELNKVSYSLPEDAEQPFAALDGVEMSVKLLPLLRMAVEADGLTVSGLNLNLNTDANGVNNWEQIFPENKTEAPTPGTNASGVPTDTSEADTGTSAGPLAVDIARVAILDSNVRLTNAVEGSSYLLENFNFESTDINVEGERFPLDISFNVALSDPVMTSDAQIKTELSANMADQVFAFRDLSANFLLSGEPFADKNVNINMTSSGQFDNANHSATLESLNLAVADALKAALKVDVTHLDDKPKLAGNIDVAPFKLNDLLEALGMEPSQFNNPDAMSAISFNGTLSGPQNSFIINPVKLTLDSTNMQGQMGIKNLDTNEFVFVLRGDKINIDDYSSPATDEEPTAAGDPNAALLPLAALRDLLFSAEFGFGEVLAGGMKITDLNMQANGNKGLIQLNTLNAKLYDGSMNMDATVDGRKDKPAIAINAKLAGVNLKPMMTEFAELDTVSGTARFDARLTTSGNSTAAFQNNLTGPLTFGIDNAVMTGLNVDKLACQAISLARTKSAETKQQWPESTAFKKLGGTFQFVNGVGTNDDLAAQLDNMKITGKGVLNLPAELVDYQAALFITGDLSDPKAAAEGEAAAEKSVCAINEKYRDIGWPVRCKGRIDAEPGDLCGIDTGALAGVAGDLLKVEAKEKLDEEKSKLKDKLTEKWLGTKKTGDASTDGAEAASDEPEDPKDALKKKALDAIFGK